jgi:hypothetical protein
MVWLSSNCIVADADGPTLQADDSAARLLFTWGRRTADRGRLHSTMCDEDLVQVARLCARS